MISLTFLFSYPLTHSLFHHSHNFREARSRELGMITYRVVPFSPVAGAMEWVQVSISPLPELFHPPNPESSLFEMLCGNQKREFEVGKSHLLVGMMTGKV